MAQQPSLKSVLIHLHSRFCKNVSGVNKSCSNLAVPVELCRLPLKIFCWRQYLIHFHRFINFYLEKAVSRRRHSIGDYAFTMMAVCKNKLDQTLKTRIRKGDGNKLRMYKTFKQALKSETYTQ